METLAEIVPLRDTAEFTAEEINVIAELLDGCDPNDDRWVSRAQCSRERVDPEMFFATDEQDDELTAAVDYSAAQKICARCPVNVSCLATAINDNLSDGVWGGFTPEQRQTVRETLGLVPHGTVRGYNTFGCRESECREALRVARADRDRPLVAEAS